MDLMAALAAAFVDRGIQPIPTPILSGGSGGSGTGIVHSGRGTARYE